MTSNATYSRTITVDLPDFASKSLAFTLLTSVAIDAANNEVFPRREYSLTLDGSGTGSIALPCPDNTGDAAWAWRVELPDGRDVTTTLAYAATSLDLSDWLTAATTSETADAITALIESKADKVSGATADNLAGLDANGNLQDSGYGVIDEDSMATDSATDVPTQQSVKAYVDAQIGTVDDVSELTTTGLTAANMLRVAAAGGLEERTPAQVLSDIGAETSGAAAAVQGNLDSHTGNTSNPHSVTAAQVGAATASSLNSYLPKTAGSGQGVTGTLYLDPGSDDTAQVITVPITTGDGADVNFNVGKVTFGGTDDVTLNWGFNNATGGPDNAAKHAWYLQLEYDYNEGGSRYSEYHLNFYNPGGGVNFRPVQYKYYTDGSGGNISFKATNFTLHDVSGTDPGLQITDVGAASQKVIFTGNLEFKFPSPGGSDSLVFKNTTDGFNPLAIAGTATEWRGSAFTIKKQDGTAVGYFGTPSAGNPYLRIDGYLTVFMTGSTNGISVVGSAGLGSPRKLLSLADSGSNLQFAISYNGAIFTNQATANTATPSGATAYQLPIYNAAGTLLGYVPIYGSAW